MENGNVYSVKDIKTGLFGPLMVMRTDAFAIRSFGQACENPEIDFHKFPEDYSLYKLASWDSENGKFIDNEPEQIANASNFVQ